MKVLPSYNALTSYTASSAVWLMRDIGKENLAKKVDRVEFEPTTSADSILVPSAVDENIHTNISAYSSRRN